MLSNWDKSFSLLIGHEGGFSDDPRDPGNKLPDGRPGSTMWGCTQANWESYVGHQVTHDDMRSLKKEDVKPLYKKKYWDAVSGDYLPSGVDYAAFDFAINAGPKRSIQMLQRALDLPDDGVLGPNTMVAIKNADATSLLRKFSNAKKAYYESLKTFSIYGKGWLARVADVEKAGLSMIGA
jgi:lysozyme family protein